MSIKIIHCMSISSKKQTLLEINYIKYKPFKSKLSSYYFTMIIRRFIYQTSKRCTIDLVVILVINKYYLS